MAIQMVTIPLPGALFERLVHRAARTHRPVEQELAEAVAGVLMDEPDVLPPDLEQASQSLAVLDDAALRQVAQARLSDEEAATMEALHMRRDREGLSTSEKEQLRKLVALYERNMLLRAEAAALLHQRGHDVGDLLRRP